MSDYIKSFKRYLCSIAIAIVVLFSTISAIFCGNLLFDNKEILSSAESSGLWSNYCATSFAGGTGISSDPYLISNASELAYLASQVNSGEVTVSRYYKLTKPIVLSDHYWVPIGQENYPFNGVLDCNNQPIIGMKVDGNYEYAGLFGLVDSLIVKNAIISSANINITSKTGSAGILAGTINKPDGSLQILNSQISGTIASDSYPSTIDGIGGAIGSIRACDIANTRIENVYIKTTISAPNRPNNTCMGALAGSSEVNLSLGTNIKNVVTNTVLNGENSSATNLTYYGDFGGSSVSPWFYYKDLQGGLPQIKSQYYIGAHIDNTGTQIVSQLQSKNYTSATSIESFIPKATKYTMTVKTEVSNNSTRSGFTASAQTRTGAPYAVYGEKVTLSNKTITGYSFDHYEISYMKNGSTVTENVTGNSFIMPNATTTIKGVFKPQTYTVTLNPNGGSVSSAKTVTYDEVASGFPIATKNGYTLNGYWTAASGGTKVVDENGNAIANVSGYTGANGTWIRASATTLYAQWNTHIYTIAYNSNGGSGTMTSQTGIAYDSVVQLKNRTISKKYVITYVFNDGSTSNQSVDIPRNFTGWKVTSGLNASTAKYGTTNNPTTAITTSTTISNSAYVKNLTTTNGATVTLSAQWGAASTSVTLVNPTRKGYIFAGWHSDSNCTTKVGDGDASYTPNANITLYAKWTAIKYQVQYNANGGSGTMSNSEHTYDVANNLTANAFTRTGYTFAGWATTESGDVTYGNQASVKNLSSTNGAVVTLYAKWTANTYTTSVYNYQPLNGGGTWLNTAQTQAGVTITPSSDGTSMTLNGSMSNANVTIGLLRGLRVKVGEQYAFKLSSLGGSFERLGTGACIALEFKRGDRSNLSSRVYKSFGDLPAIGESAISGAVTITEQNQQEIETCSFWIWYGSAANSNGKWGYKFTNYKLSIQLIKLNTSNSITQTYGSKTKTATVPTLAGFSFKGWQLNSATSGVQLTDASGNVQTNVSGYTDANGNWVHAGNVNIYSTWTPITYTASFNAGSGSVSPSSRKYTYGAFYETLPTPTRTGYTFNGWYGNIDGYTILDYIQSTGTQYIDTGVYTTSDIKVYADFQYTDVSTRQQRPFGHTFDTDTSKNVSFGAYINGAGKWAFAYQDGKGNWTASTVSASTTRTNITLDGVKKLFSIRGPATYDYNITTTITRQSNSSISIFADNRTGSPDNFSKMKLYAFKVWKNSTLIRDYIPVKRNSDGVIGLFDLTSGTLYTNAGTGSFTAGTTSSSGTVKYDYVYKYLSSDKTLTAKWVEITFNVSAVIESSELQYATITLSATKVTYNSTVELSLKGESQKVIANGSNMYNYSYFNIYINGIYKQRLIADITSADSAGRMIRYGINETISITITQNTTITIKNGKDTS